MTTEEMQRVQKVIQGLLDASNEIMTEFMSKKRACKWDIANEGLYNGDMLNNELSAELRKLGLAPTTSQSRVDEPVRR